MTNERIKMGERYSLMRGKFGTYFHDDETDHDLTNDEVFLLLESTDGKSVAKIQGILGLVQQFIKSCGDNFRYANAIEFHDHLVKFGLINDDVIIIPQKNSHLKCPFLDFYSNEQDHEFFIKWCNERNEKRELEKKLVNLSITLQKSQDRLAAWKAVGGHCADAIVTMFEDLIDDLIKNGLKGNKQ